MSKTCCCCCFPFKAARYNSRRKIVLFLAGLDNAGKSTAAKGLAGELQNERTVPTVGFSSIKLIHRGYSVIIYDLGGGSQIRGIWYRYFSDVHGVIFVIDASDEARIDESKGVLESMLLNERLAGKPVLVLANKQDVAGALDEIDIVERLNLEQLVNDQKCPTLVEVCSARVSGKKQSIDPGLLNGYRWLLRHIIKNYSTLNARVESDGRLEAEKIQRQRELWKQKRSLEIESDSPEPPTPGEGGFFKPISAVIREMENKTTVVTDYSQDSVSKPSDDSMDNSTSNLTHRNGVNGFSSTPLTDITADIRAQLKNKGKKQRRKHGGLSKSNRISPESDGLPPLILPGPRGPLSRRNVVASPSNIEQDALRKPHFLRPLTSRSLGSEGCVWGLGESLEVVHQTTNFSEKKKGKKSSDDNDDVVSG